MTKPPRSEKKALFSRPIHYDDGLLTSIVRYQEADCIARIFTRQSGFISAFCKRGFVNRKGFSPLQAPALAKIGFIGKGENLMRLVSCDLDPMLSMPASLKAFGYSAYIAEVIEKLLPEGDADHDIFSLIEEAFYCLKQEAHPGWLRAFELKLLSFCGYLPELPTINSSIPVVAFDQNTSRFITEEIDGAFRFSHDALKLLQSMLIAKLGAVKYEGPDELLMIGRIFQNRLKLMGCLPLKSVAFLKQVAGRR